MRWTLGASAQREEEEEEGRGRRRRSGGCLVDTPNEDGVSVQSRRRRRKGMAF
jgi:hypothetical protein